MNLPKMEACGRFIAEPTGDYSAPIIIASVEISAGEIRGEIATEISRRCNEYDELKARVAELEKQNAELSAKNPDTERMDWLSEGGFALLLIGPDQTIREAIDANRKNGGAA